MISIQKFLILGVVGALPLAFIHIYIVDSLKEEMVLRVGIFAIEWAWDMYVVYEFYQAVRAWFAWRRDPLKYFFWGFAMDSPLHFYLIFWIINFLYICPIPSNKDYPNPIPFDPDNIQVKGSTFPRDIENSLS
jgi:hypothetical protein